MCLIPNKEYKEKQIVRATHFIKSRLLELSTLEENVPEALGANPAAFASRAAGVGID